MKQWVDIYGDGSCYQAVGNIEGMTSPVQCGHCSGTYDLGKVTVTARYADCSIWKTPCCGRSVDDRGEGRDYTVIDKRRVRGWD